MSATGPLPVWAPGHTRRRGPLRRSCISLSNPTALTLIALFVITGTLTWLLVHGTTTANTSSPLSQLPDDMPQIQIPTIRQEVDMVSQTTVSLRTEANSTLNFEKIFAINLPSRLDRKDLLTVMARYTNLSVTIVPGVSSIADNALPPPRTAGALRPEEYRVWRAHANVWRRVIEEGLSTALVMEDDNDWDRNLKEQVPRVMEALEDIRAVVRRDDGEGVVRGGPAVEEWDLLYLGTCWEAATLADRTGRRTMVPIPSDRENVAPHNYNWVLPLSPFFIYLLVFGAYGR
jgi:hypothetical protein